MDIQAPCFASARWWPRLLRDRTRFPEELGFEPLSDEGEAISKESGMTMGEAPELNESSWQRYRLALLNPRFMIACLAIGFQSMARYGLLIWVPVHFLGEDWKNSDAKWMTLALPIGMALGAIANGWLSDRVFHSNRSKVIAMFLLLASVCSLAMYLLPRDHWLGAPMLLLTGFFAYGPQSAFWALCPDLLGSKRSGTGTGLMNTFAYVFAGLGEPLIGWMIESRGQTSLVFGVVATACLTGALISPLSVDRMNLVELAQRIRKHRLEKRLTLEDVASRSGLTRSWLSKVENFRITPSLPALAQIASALGVTVAELVQGLDAKPTLIKVTKDERLVVERDQSPTNTTVYESLAHKRPHRSMDPFLLTIPAVWLGMTRWHTMAKNS